MAGPSAHPLVYAKRYASLTGVVTIFLSFFTSHEYVLTDVNEYMKGLDSKARYLFLDRVKVGLFAPFQLWS